MFLLPVLNLMGGFGLLAYSVYATWKGVHEEKAGKKVLTKTGKRLLVPFVICSVLLLSTGTYDQYRGIQDKLAAAVKENARLEEARARDQGINAQLSKQLADSSKISSDLKEASKKLDDNANVTTGMSRDLGTQLGVTNNVSKTLVGAVTSINKTSKATNDVLSETVEKMDYLEVYLVVMIDPLAVKDDDGKMVLSKKSLQLLEDDRAGRIDLSKDDEKQDSIIAEFQRRYALVRNSVFANWNISISLEKKRPGTEVNFFGIQIPFPDLALPDMLVTQQGDNGVLSFVIASLSDDERLVNGQHKGYRGVNCLMRYLISPNRYAGFRRYTDLNGLLWGIDLHIDSDLADVQLALLSTGNVSDALPMSRAEFLFSSTGSYEGIKEIPKDVFKPANKR